MENDSVRYLRLSGDFSNSFFRDNFEVNTDSFYITPGYPFFLSFFSSQNIKLIIFFQFLLLAASQLILYRLILNLTSRKIANLSLLIFILESSSNIESFNLLTETLFNFFFVIFLFLFSKKKVNNLTILFAGFSLGIAMLVRPVGQILLAPLLIVICFSSYRKQLMFIFVIALTVAGSWIVRNQIVYSVPQLSGIQSLNLLQYEGAGALAKESSLSIAEIQLDESRREKSKVDELATVRQIVDYRNSRGTELILNNPKGFLLLHLEGAFKILFGPGSAGIAKLTEHFPLSKIFILGSQILSGLLRIVVTVSVLFFIYTSVKKKSLVRVEFFAILAWFLILISSGGANAYSRFRVPLIPLEIIIISIGLKSLPNETQLGNIILRRMKLKR
jgi:4-amino-4-deoxy-L-arabinose transferase-like glycosyltransferase